MIFAIAVDNSIGFKRKEYFFEYKGCEFKYVPQYSHGDTDDFVCRLKRGESYQKIYELMAEFLSSLSFATNAKIIPYPGAASDIDYPLKDISIAFRRKRSINVEEMMDEFYYIPPLETDDQIQLAGLYRQANAANSTYLKILFYWHALVYPSQDDNTAVDFLNKMEQGLPKEIAYIRDTLDNIKQKQTFLSTGRKSKSFGNYIKLNIRHSIGHIVREKNKWISLRIDSWEQDSHLEDIADVLKAVCRYRLQNNFRMNAPHKLKIFHYIDP